MSTPMVCTRLRKLIGIAVLSVVMMTSAHTLSATSPLRVTRWTHQITPTTTAVPMLAVIHGGVWKNAM
jgi:hypothetical protein